MSVGITAAVPTRGTARIHRLKVAMKNTEKLFRPKPVQSKASWHQLQPGSVAAPGNMAISSVPCIASGHSMWARIVSGQMRILKGTLMMKRHRVPYLSKKLRGSDYLRVLKFWFTLCVANPNINDAQYYKWLVQNYFPSRAANLHRRNGQCISSFCNDTFREFGFLALKSVRVGQSLPLIEPSSILVVDFVSVGACDKLASWNSPA